MEGELIGVAAFQNHDARKSAIWPADVGIPEANGNLVARAGIPFQGVRERPIGEE